MLNRSCETRHLLPRSQILEEKVFENIFYHVVAEFPISYFLWIDDKFCQILFLNLLMWSPHFSFWFVNRESYIVCQWILSQPYISSIHFSWSQCIYFYMLVDLICYYFLLRMFVFMFVRGIDLQFSLLIRSIDGVDVKLFFLQKSRNKWYYFFLKCLVEFIITSLVFSL